MLFKRFLITILLLSTYTIASIGVGFQKGQKILFVSLDFHGKYLSNAEIGYLQDFLKNDRGSVFFLGMIIGDTVEKNRILIKDLPTATLSANPGIPNAVTEFNTSIQVVTLTSGNVDDSIIYTIFHEDGTTDIGIFVGSGLVTVTGDDTITATVYGDNVSPQNETWYFNQSLPNTTLSSSPLKTSFYKYKTTDNSEILSDGAISMKLWQHH